jgi:hypothetical protein
MPYKNPKLRKEKNAEYSRKYYEANKEKVKALSRINRRKGQEKWKEFKATLKCAECNFSNPAALDFHHIDPNQKENLVSELVSDGCYAAAYEEVKNRIVCKLPQTSPQRENLIYSP